METLLDKNKYNEADLLTIRVALCLPYQNDTKDFERITGEIKHNGKIYKYVKRKIENGEFVLLCLPDQNKMHIQNAKNDFCQNTNDIVHNNTSKKSGSPKSISSKKIFSEYDQYSFIVKIKSPFSILQRFKNLKGENLLSSLHISPEQPPDFLQS